MLIVKANPATGDRGAQKQTKSWWDGPQNNRHARTSKAIRAELIGPDTCTALGLTINSSSPVLALRRALIEAGHDPATSLEAYRGETLGLRIRSIGDGGRLEINGEGTGFRRRRQPDATGMIPRSQQPAGGGGAANVPGSGTGWAHETPLGPPPGVAQADRLMDAQDAKDRAELIEREARFKAMEGKP